MLGESGYRRVENDKYYTPAWCTKALLRAMPPAYFGATAWEPAAGSGAMSDVLKQHGLAVVETDIMPDRNTIIPEDFLATDEDYMPDVGAIITNPPYSVAEAFIVHALRLMQDRRGKVAMLLRNEYDCAKKRRHLFANCRHFHAKIVLTKRPKWFADDRASPRHNYAWYVWDFARSLPEQPPMMLWGE